MIDGFVRDAGIDHHRPDETKHHAGFNVQRFANVPHVKPRLARLTLAFSKELPNFKAAIAFNIAYYNFVKTHGTLRCTPAMAAGVERSAWTIGDCVDAC